MDQKKFEDLMDKGMLALVYSLTALIVIGGSIFVIWLIQHLK